jgi:hypothetical protein
MKIWTSGVLTNMLLTCCIYKTVLKMHIKCSTNATGCSNTILCLVYFLSTENPAEHTVFINLKIVEVAGTCTPGFYSKTIVYMIYMIHFSHECHKPIALVCISPSQFSTVNENTKQISEWLTRTETQTDLICITVSRLQLPTAIQDKQ